MKIEKSIFCLIAGLFVVTVFAEEDSEINPNLIPPVEKKIESLLIPDLFSNGMVIQQEKPIRIWGEGNPGQSIEVELEGETKKAAFEGNRWSVEFPPQKAAGQVLSIKISLEGKVVRKISDVLVGEVWLASGQSNINLRLGQCIDFEKYNKRPSDKLLRSFLVDAKLLTDNLKGPQGTVWMSAEKEKMWMWGAVAYHFIYSLRQSLNIPVAIIECSRGGTLTEAWCRRGMLEKFPQYKELAVYKYNDNEKMGLELKASYCFERMLTTVIPYSIRGVIWYQGEGNSWDFAFQEALFTMMVGDWRSLFGDEKMPFYFVQLPRLIDSPWHGFRNAQRKIAGSLPYSFMAVTIDIPMDYEFSRDFAGSQAYELANPLKPTDPARQDHPIHPLIKAPVGERLALGAKALVYGLKGEGEYTGPMVKEALLQQGKIRVNFDFAIKGLKSSDEKPLRGFYVSGDGMKFIEAKATIEWDHLWLDSFGEMRPKLVRYGAEYDIPKTETLNLNLVNQDNLPASPFTLEITP